MQNVPRELVRLGVAVLMVICIGTSAQQLRFDLSKTSGDSKLLPVFLTIQDCESIRGQDHDSVALFTKTNITADTSIEIDAGVDAHRINIFDCFAVIKAVLASDRDRKRGAWSEGNADISSLLEHENTLLKNNAYKLGELRAVAHMHRTRSATENGTDARVDVSAAQIERHSPKVILAADVRVRTQILGDFVTEASVRVEKESGGDATSADYDTRHDDDSATGAADTPRGTTREIDPEDADGEYEVYGGVTPTSVPSHLDVLSSAPNDGLFPVPSDYITNNASIVYIVGTGIRTDHYEFINPVNSISRASVIYDAYPTLPAYCEGHETCTASLAGGRTVGVNPNSLIFGVRVLDCNGAGWLSDVVAGTYALATHCQAYGYTKTPVASYSLGGETTSMYETQITAAAFVEFREQCGGIALAAAGNSARDAQFFLPAGLSSDDVGKVMTVAASTKGGAWASFSNFGAVVDIIAPGVSIYCAVESGTTSYASMSGTSASCPLAAGIASLHAGDQPLNYYSSMALSIRSKCNRGKGPSAAQSPVCVEKLRGSAAVRAHAVLYADSVRLRMFDDAKDGYVTGVPANTNTVNRFLFLNDQQALGDGQTYVARPPNNGDISNIVPVPDPPGLYYYSSASRMESGVLLYAYAISSLFAFAVSVL